MTVTACNVTSMRQKRGTTSHLHADGLQPRPGFLARHLAIVASGDRGRKHNKNQRQTDRHEDRRTERQTSRQTDKTETDTDAQKDETINTHRRPQETKQGNTEKTTTDADTQETDTQKNRNTHRNT